MAALYKYCRMSVNSMTCHIKSKPQICSIADQLSQLRLGTSAANAAMRMPNICGLHTSTTCKFHKSATTHDLMEFFDRKDMWGETSVPAGRPYRLDELRIKSNQDLHKLWYVLLKERNMLLTMEAEYNRNCELFPSPERITKVEESMENIMEVVKERDNAVSLLETGKPSEPGGAYVRDFLGRVVWRNFQEYAVPPHMNKVYRLLYPKGFKRQHLKYLPLWREKIARYRWGHYHRQLREKKKLLEEFPHLEEKLQVPLPEEPKVN